MTILKQSILKKFVFILIFWSLLIFFAFRTIKKLPNLEDLGDFLSPNTLIGVSAFLLFFSLAMVFRAYRFGFLIRLSSNISWFRIARAFPWLFLLGAITPLRLGEGMRALWVQKNGGSSPEALSYWFGERITDLIILALLLLVGIIGINWEFNFIFVPVLAIITLFYLSIHFSKRILGLFRFRFPNLYNFVNEFLLGFKFLYNWKLYRRLLFVSLIIWTSMLLAFVVGYQLLIPEASFLACVLTLATVNMSYLFAVTPGNIGGYQAATVAAMAAYGISSPEVLIASIIINVATILLTMVYGICAKIADLIFIHWNDSDNIK